MKVSSLAIPEVLLIEPTVYGDERGFFYYQKRRFYTVKKPYMRWSQAWMLYALARLLEAKCR